MNFPLVSIIIPLYNKESSIRSTIDSVLNQNFSNFEIVVVDDGSTDNSSTIVKNINDNRIHYYYKDNEGVSVARNYGVQKAFGEWVMFLDAGGVLLCRVI
uniref:glycosyltransferase family 2 protein n=1 Tax=Holdemanella biformis TaxID=1735 RepID=UPI002666B07F